MEDEIWKIKDNLCRCCHAEGVFSTFSEAKSDFNEFDYARMILECLNISITELPGKLSQIAFSICEKCKGRLKDAVNFKKQIQMCEDKLMNLIKNNLIDIVKEEVDDWEEQEVYYPESDSDIEDKRNINFKIEDEPSAPPKTSTSTPTKSNTTASPKANTSSPKTRQQPKRQAAKKDVADVPLKKVAAQKVAPQTVAAKKNLKSPKATVRKTPANTKQATVDGVFQDKEQNKGLVRFFLRESDYTVSEDGTEYTCSRCNQRFNAHSTLRNHVKYKHYNISKYKCPKCPEIFRTVVPFVQHKLHEHDIDDRFYCNACEKVFNTKIQLKKHRDIFHMLGQKLKCPSCTFETFSFEGLYKHRFKHRETKDYHCTFCKKSFLRRTTLQLHERIHTGDRRKVCSVCGQAFVQKASLNYHMTKYHPDINF